MIVPLAVVYALTTFVDIKVISSFLFPVVSANINCKRSGRWLISVDFAMLYAEGGILATDFPNASAERSRWWSSKMSHFTGLGDKKTHERHNTFISFGPVCADNREAFMEVTEQLLAYQPVSQIYVSKTISNAVRNQILKFDDRV
jgi:hypothetical protein